MSKPIHKVRFGLIEARIWRKQTRSGTRHTISVVRLFRNGDLWKESSRFGPHDVPLLRLVLDHAYTWLLTNVRTETKSAGPGRVPRSTDTRP